MTNQDPRRSLSWDHGTISVERLGAMLGPAIFLLPEGRKVTPLHVAPWSPDEVDEPAMMRGLRGEWPCVPFGYTSPATPETPPDWASVMGAAAAYEEVHGHGSNHEWTWLDKADALALTIDYPESHPIRCLHRCITPDPNAPALDFTLRIEARSDVEVPLGLHFTFWLPSRPDSLRIEPGGFREGRTYPGIVEPGATAFAVDQSFTDLSMVPAWGGGWVDATRLPFERRIEELVQLNGVEGTAVVAYPFEGFRARVEWDPAVFPSLLLWISNGGRTATPWSGRHYALGMEPVRSPFGLGPMTAAALNPLNRSGTPTAWAMRAGDMLETRYRLHVEPL